jgi:hypothetical protein
VPLREAYWRLMPLRDLGDTVSGDDDGGDSLSRDRFARHRSWETTLTSEENVPTSTPRFLITFIDSYSSVVSLKKSTALLQLTRYGKGAVGVY